MDFSTFGAFLSSIIAWNICATSSVIGNTLVPASVFVFLWYIAYPMFSATDGRYSQFCSPNQHPLVSICRTPIFAFPYEIICTLLHSIYSTPHRHAQTLEIFSSGLLWLLLLWLRHLAILRQAEIRMDFLPEWVVCLRQLIEVRQSMAFFYFLSHFLSFRQGGHTADWNYSRPSNQTIKNWHVHDIYQQIQIRIDLLLQFPEWQAWFFALWQFVRWLQFPTIDKMWFSINMVLILIFSICPYVLSRSEDSSFGISKYPFLLNLVLP